MDRDLKRHLIVAITSTILMGGVMVLMVWLQGPPKNRDTVQ